MSVDGLHFREDQGLYTPRGHHLTTLTACVCLRRVDKYVTLRSSPLLSMLHSCLYVSSNLAILVNLDSAYPDVAIAACGCESTFALSFKVCRINGSVVVVPGHQERSGFHRDCVAGIRARRGRWCTKRRREEVEACSSGSVMGWRDKSPGRSAVWIDSDRRA